MLANREDGSRQGAAPEKKHILKEQILSLNVWSMTGAEKHTEGQSLVVIEIPSSRYTGGDIRYYPQFHIQTLGAIVVVSAR